MGMGAARVLGWYAGVWLTMIGEETVRFMRVWCRIESEASDEIVDVSSAESASVVLPVWYKDIKSLQFIIKLEKKEGKESFRFEFYSRRFDRRSIII
jgi:hypothetical protein